MFGWSWKKWRRDVDDDLMELRDEVQHVLHAANGDQWRVINHLREVTEKVNSDLSALETEWREAADYLRKKDAEFPSARAVPDGT